MRMDFSLQYRFWDMHVIKNNFHCINNNVLYQCYNILVLRKTLAAVQGYHSQYWCSYSDDKITLTAQQ